METTYKSTKGRLTDADKDVTMAWEMCASKARLVLNIEYTALTPHGLPFMSVGVWHALARQLKWVPSAMVEISSWFSPLVYNQRVISGRWKIGSASANMIHAITSHPDLRCNHSLLSMNTLVWSLVRNFPALLRMKDELSKINMPLRPDSAKHVKEFMLLEGETKITTRRKGGAQSKSMTAQQLESSNAPQPELVEINKEIGVVDDALKAAIKQVFRDGIPDQRAVEWGKRWSCKIHVQPPSASPMYRTLTILNYHTATWGSPSGNSEARSRRETICSTIIEFCIINDYQRQLLHEAHSASAFMRSALEITLSMHTNPSKSRGIVDNDEDDDLCYIIHWPDGIDVDTMKLKDVVFDSVEENRRNIRIATRKKDYDSIKKVINVLQLCPPAWPLGSESRKDTPSKSHAVHAELDAPLREIVKILTESAYEHREKSCNMSLDVNVSHMPNQDRFEFKFKQRQDEDDEDDEDVIDNEQDADNKLNLKHKWTTFLFPLSKTRERIEELIEALGVSLPTGGNDNVDDTTGIDTMHEDPLSTTVLVPPFTQANPAAIMVPLDNPASGHMPVPIHPSALDDNNDTNDDDDESMYWKDIDTASGGLVRTQPIDDDEGT
ncbi:hypothetical protein JVU11DRAFT_1130 [Chiua virens]|nr:hypothetical protein JVU11DRAFT_1130 [Chiua virens]